MQILFQVRMLTCVLFIFNPHLRTPVEGKGGKRGGNNWLTLLQALTGYGTCSPDMCPDQELNPQPFSLLDDAPTD